jgi:hypothetical protein
MRDNSIKPIYLALDSSLSVVKSEIDFNDVFQSDKPSDQLYFSFESRYAPYQYLSYDDIGNRDLVVQDVEKNYLCPLEVKLTVLPDKVTADRKSTLWGSSTTFRASATFKAKLSLETINMW